MKAYKTHPVLKEKIWGGQKLASYNKKIGDGIIGESWETYGEEAMLPILIKLIDANDILSVQVHPDDGYAITKEKQKNGKSEAWIILDCEEGSQIVYGFKKPMDRHSLQKAIANDSLLDMLNLVNVKKGDCVYIPAGTVHTLGKGIVAYEIQQPSDLTYRIYDWNRTDIYGCKRELHIDKALDVMDYSDSQPEITNIYHKIKHQHTNVIFENEFFNARYFTLPPKTIYKFENNNNSTITIISGNAYIVSEGERIFTQKGDTWILPKQQQPVYIEGLYSVEFIETSSSYNNKNI